MKNIFIVDDEEPIRYVLEHYFTKRGYQVKTFSGKDHIIQLATEHNPDLILLDIHLKGEDGRHICKEIQEQVPHDIPILLFSASPQALANPEGCQPDGTIDKPFELEALMKKFEQVISEKNTDENKSIA